MSDDLNLSPTMFTVQAIKLDGYQAPILRLRADAWDSLMISKTSDEFKRISIELIPSSSGAEDEPCPVVIVDLQDIKSFTSDSGFDLLGHLLKAPIKEKGLYWVVALVGVHKGIQALHELLRFDELFPIYPNPQGALLEIHRHPRPTSREEIKKLIQLLCKARDVEAKV